MEVNDQAYGARKSSIDFFKNTRQSLAELYDSEKHFFIPAIGKSQTALDVGCAVGGGYRFSKEVNPCIEYTGIDICENLIHLAKQVNPNGQFHTFDGRCIGFEDNKFDSVFSFGVVHHLPHWKEMIGEMNRVAKKYTLFDMRLSTEQTLNDSNKYFQKIAFNEEWDQKTAVPYLVISQFEAKDFFENLIQPNEALYGYGYWCKPTQLAVIPYQEVYTIALLIEKNSKTPGIHFNFSDLT